MTLEVRKQVYQALLARSKNGKVGRHDTKEVAAQFNVQCVVFRFYGREVKPP
ncbi:hypothetical protein PR202_gb23484 [Eleusine coracana subsp. coracana]|uniref:DUF7769 domain-containing protein n=1 Tax=Eleusine coracana subsp. coracana TaxID=191504 RepID=A0AAV5FIS2_ELECO|nr:hypothetical protein PR202_gb23484 [Eleusine coracana subsp. coracana]